MGGRGQLQPDGHAGAVAPDRHRDRAKAEVVDPGGITHDAAVDPETAIALTASCAVSAIPGSQSRHRNGSPTPMRTPARSRVPAWASLAERRRRFYFH